MLYSGFCLFGYWDYFISRIRLLKILMLSEFPNSIINALFALGITDSKMKILFLMGLKYVQLIKMKGE